jgi:hypothetical protein
MVMNSPMLWIAVFVMIVVLVIAFALYMESERRKQLQSAADQIHFAFSPDADPALLQTLGLFHLFSLGYGGRIRNVMRGSVGDVAVTLFDYTYRTGGGKHNHTHSQTVALFESQRLQLPLFFVRPEHLFHKIAGSFGYQDIDFEANPAFSDTYLLQGPDEERIRALFDEQVLAFYTRHGNLCTEGGGQRLVHYQQHRRTHPENIQEFLQEGLDVLALYVEKDESGDDLFLLGLDLATA